MFTSTGAMTAEKQNVKEDLAGLWRDLSKQGEVEDAVSLTDDMAVDQFMETAGTCIMTIE